MNRILFLLNLVMLIALIVATFHEHSDPKQPEELAATSEPPWEKPASSPGQLFAGIQVNSLPHPFNLNGTLPYQVWVDGERLPLRGEKVDKIIELLDLGEFKQPEDTAEIHNGEGWLRPLPTTKLID